MTYVHNIKNELGTETIAHLSCLYNTKESIDRILDELDEKGVKNILALRGDVNPDFAIEKDFKYASDLTEYIMSKTEVLIFQAHAILKFIRKRRI